MVTRKKNEGTDEKKGRVKVDKLRVNKETVKDLTSAEAKNIKGGFGSGTCPTVGGPPTCWGCDTKRACDV